MRVAIVWNYDQRGVIDRFGHSCQGEYGGETAENVVAVLQEGGHETLLCEGDKGLLATLERFMPPDPQARPTGMVFNTAAGTEGECRLTHVPAMLEMAGSRTPDPARSGMGWRSIRLAGCRTPNFRVMRRNDERTASRIRQLRIAACK